MNKNNAFSGLEAAVVMIAFVAVAAVFAYALLSTGFFATQKLRDVTYAGVKQSSSAVITDGFIRGRYDGTQGGLVSLSFSISVPETGQAVDLSKMIYYYSKNSDAGDSIPMDYVTPNTGILQPGSSERISLNLKNAMRTGPMEGEKFTLEIKPPMGASTLIQRSLPAGYNGGYIS